MRETQTRHSPSDAPKTGGELFIVDNSDEAWKGLRYLQDWTEIASACDIETGFFDATARKVGHHPATPCRLRRRFK